MEEVLEVEVDQIVGAFVVEVDLVGEDVEGGKTGTIKMSLVRIGQIAGACQIRMYPGQVVMVEGPGAEVLAGNLRGLLEMVIELKQVVGTIVVEVILKPVVLLVKVVAGKLQIILLGLHHLRGINHLLLKVKLQGKQQAILGDSQTAKA